ncbi:Nucleoredoxin [Bagarius yarrelli]|uniref:Nucleoredoxin n=1 Tax=Bagarius yarrelli TaxID=175774 RepID=A0A556UZZ8_BAGYA|nr:Nucleoredoxin [Bagarius yarrelli]
MWYGGSGEYLPPVCVVQAEESETEAGLSERLSLNGGLQRVDKKHFSTRATIEQQQEQLSLEFPWGPKPFAEVVSGPLLSNNRQTTDSSTLEGSYVGVYFSAHWVLLCVKARAGTVLRQILALPLGKLVLPPHQISSCYQGLHFRTPVGLMPAAGMSAAVAGFYVGGHAVSGIPTLILLDAEGHMITRQGRVEVLNDPECHLFPWHPRPVLELSESNAVQLHEGPCLVLFVDAEEEGELEPAKELIQPIAEKIMAKYKAKDEETPLLFFVAGEDDMSDSLRDYTNLPEAAPLLTILDMSARAKYVKDVEEITPTVVEQFVSDFLAEKLKPEPI